jgi:immunoglobulin-binding protein 1
MQRVHLVDSFVDRKISKPFGRYLFMVRDFIRNLCKLKLAVAASMSRTATSTVSPYTGESLAQRYAQAVSLVDTAPDQAVTRLSDLQHEVASKALLSVGSETLDDMSTSALPLLLLEHHLAMAYTQLPTRGIADIATRQSNLRMACDLWSAFLAKLEALEQLDKPELSEYRDLLERSDQTMNDDERRNESSLPAVAPLVNREAKIARFRAKQQAENEQGRLESLRERRGRIGIADEEEMDGHDAEGLQRSLALASLEIAKATCLDEWAAVLRELPMIAMMVREQNERQDKQGRYHVSDGTAQSRNEQAHTARRGGAPETTLGPLQVTHITQDGATGQLLFRREEIKANVLRPGWNQPTMSLEELADREVAGALEREARQKESEAHRLTQPRRLEQLRKDGQENDADLVDASAALDRQWDDFKDENPRGSGNKRGDVGDRNF